MCWKNKKKTTPVKKSSRQRCVFSNAIDSTIYVYDKSSIHFFCQDDRLRVKKLLAKIVDLAKIIKFFRKRNSDVKKFIALLFEVISR